MVPINVGFRIFLLAVLAFGCACAAPETVGREKTAKTAIQTVLDDPTSHEGRELSLSGVFTGWKGNCRGGPPASRSDWMLEDSTGCLYVSGPTPEGLQVTAPNNEPVEVVGIFRRSASGIPYLELKPKK